MNTRTRRRLAFLGVLVAFVSGACTIMPGPPGASAPPPASGPPPHASAASPPAGPRYEDNTWRPGGDLRTFDLPQGGPEACATACEKEPACYAYSYVKPDNGTYDAGQCSLKHNVPLANKNACCVSGVIRPWP